MYMNTVGVGELRQNLRRYLRRVWVARQFERLRQLRPPGWLAYEPFSPGPES
jgi:hypothetical protein